MENKNSYLPLISEWEQYLAETKQPDLNDFALWILKKQDGHRHQEEKELQEYFNDNSSQYDFGHKSSEAAFLLWRLGKFIRFYTKPILLQNGLASQDDFAILSHVQFKTTCSKGEAIEANIIDGTTGIEIIKRLVKQGLLVEQTNPEDKRQKLITLTELGHQKLFSIYTGFSTIQDVMADMTIDQREILIQTLKDLDLFHTKNIEILSNISKK